MKQWITSLEFNINWIILVNKIRKFERKKVNNEIVKMIKKEADKQEKKTEEYGGSRESRKMK